MPTTLLTAVAPPFRGWRRALGEFLYGLAGLEFVHQASRMRHEMADLFLLVTHGDLIGLPILPPYYSLRLLPHVIPEIDGWKRHLLAEKEAFEREDFHLHQM